MTVQLPLREGALRLEQWQHLEALAATLSPEQARWISGYFAGFDAGLLRAGGIAALPAVAPGARTLTILYGTETGNSRALGVSLAALAKDRGLGAKLVEMADYKPRELKYEQDILLVVSTHGEGDPPQPALPFFEFLEGPRAPRLDGVRYSILALGDSTYEKYCEAGKRIDRRLAELGAKRLADRVDCDIDYEESAGEWSANMVALLASDEETPDGVYGRTAFAVPAQSPAIHDKNHPFHATVLESIRIVGRHSSKDTRHIELDLSGSGLSYQPGDALGVVAANAAETVEELLSAAGLAGEDEVEVKGSVMRLASALTDRFEISIASPRFIEKWAGLSGSAELERLAGAEAVCDRIAFLHDHHVADIIRRFPATGIDAESLLAGLRPLQPRLYSIASSQAAVGDEAHLTVAPLRYKLHGTTRLGVASTHIADRLETGATIPVYVQENPHFRLPADDVPIIMIGPGTGIAPFRAFLQQREMRGAAGRSWLFFGERTLRSDFLYQLEWQQWLKDGVLSRLDVAFSRDSASKVYVQHRLAERSRELFTWLEEGAHLYVCGDEKAMARDVHSVLVEIFAREGGSSPERAEERLAALAADRRYQRDVY